MRPENHPRPLEDTAETPPPGEDDLGAGALGGWAAERKPFEYYAAAVHQGRHRRHQRIRILSCAATVVLVVYAVAEDSTPMFLAAMAAAVVWWGMTAWCRGYCEDRGNRRRGRRR